VLIRCDGGEDRVGHDTLVMGFFIGPEAGVDAVVVQQGSAQANRSASAAKTCPTISSRSLSLRLPQDAHGCLSTLLGPASRHQPTTCRMVWTSAVAGSARASVTRGKGPFVVPLQQ
jgi:hypothetical protein